MPSSLDISELVGQWTLADWCCQIVDYVNDWIRLPTSSRQFVSCRDYVTWRLEQQAQEPRSEAGDLLQSPEVRYHDVDWDPRSEFYRDYALARLRDSRMEEIHRDGLFLLYSHLAQESRLQDLDHYEAELANRILTNSA